MLTRAAEILGLLRSKRAVDTLHEALKNKDLSVRQQVVIALGEIGSEMSVSALSQALNDENRLVRWYAAEALGKIGSELAIPALAQALHDDEDSRVRQSVAAALGEIGSEKSVHVLIEALEDWDNDVVWSVAWALVDIDGRQAVTDLIDALQDQDVHDFARFTISEVLGEIGDEQAIEALHSVLYDEAQEKELREHVASILDQVESEQASVKLRSESQDKNRKDTQNAKGNGKQINYKQDIAAIISDLHHTNRKVRERAAEALGQIGNNQAVGALIQAMRDRDGNVRWSAVEALGRIGGESVVVALIQGLGDDVVRERVAKAIGQIDNQALGRGLLRGLMNNDDFVRRKAALAIGYYREDEQTLKNLVHLVSVDSVTEVRDAANAGMEKFRRKLEYFNHLFITTTTNPPSPPNLPPPLAAQERAELETQIAAKYQEAMRSGEARQKGKALEELLAALFASIPGFTVIERNYHTATEEIDLALRNASADPFWRGLGSLILVEAKNWQSQRVGKNEYAQFYRKLENRGGHCLLGFLICTERFAETWRQERLRDSKFPLRVVPIDGEDLRRLVEATDRAAVLREFVERAMLT